MNGTIGEIRLFAGNFAPRTWAFCEGQLLAISQNTALFSILGTTFGGDGRTTMGLPDLKSRVALHPGTGPGLPTYQLGQKGGAATTSLTTAQMPQHNHTGNFKVADGTGNSFGANGNYLASKAKDVDAGTNAEVYKLAANATFTAGNTVNGGTSDNNGSGQQFSNTQPVLGLRFIICLTGIYPSRS